MTTYHVADRRRRDHSCAHLCSRISVIPQTSTTRPPHVGIGGSLVVESRKNGQFFRGIIWWGYLVGSTGFSRPPARPPVAAPPRAPPRALGSGHPAPHRGAPFAARSLCFVAAGQRIKLGPRARFSSLTDGLLQLQVIPPRKLPTSKANVQGTYFAVANKWHHISPLRRCLGQPRRHLR
jgi:hypothetical protein